AGTDQGVSEVVLSVVPSALAAFAVANTEAAQLISTSVSADAEALLAAAAAALGPIGASYLATFGPAQAHNLAATQQLAGVHAAIAGAVEAAKSSFVATDI